MRTSASAGWAPRMIVLLACTLLPAIPLGAPAARDQNSPRTTPEQSFNLYARFLLEGDPTAADDFHALVGVPPSDETRQQIIHRIVIGDTPQTGEAAQLGAQLVGELTVRLRALQCRASGSKQRVDDGVHWAAVDYTCQLPDLAAVLPEMTLAELYKRLESDPLATVRISIDLLKRAPGRAQTGSLMMAQDPDTNVWVPQDMPPLHAWIAMMLPQLGVPGPDDAPGDATPR